MNIKQTIINLDRVLGAPLVPKVTSAKVAAAKALATTKPIATTKPVTNNPPIEIDLGDFVEKVNGRCAVTGLYIGKATFQFTGQDLIHQLADDPVKSTMLIGSDISVVLLLSAIFYKKIDYENIFEFGEIVMYRFAMLQWVYIICGYFF